MPSYDSPIGSNKILLVRFGKGKSGKLYLIPGQVLGNFEVKHPAPDTELNLIFKSAMVKGAAVFVDAKITGDSSSLVGP